LHSRIAYKDGMSETFLTLGGIPVSVGEALAAFACMALALLGAIAVMLARATRARRVEAARREMHVDELGERMAEIARIQADTAGRVHTMGEVLSGRQAELARAVSERLDAVTHRIGLSMQTSTQHTMENLAKLNERLAVIDGAQKNLTELSSQVTSLRQILANKQARGAFGQGRMEAIVQDGLPKGGYVFQPSLSNNKRPDCAVSMPDGRSLVIDAKFPLEAITALQDARDEAEREIAKRRVRQDVLKHVNDIAERYLLPGETQDLALMFVPSESIYAELYDGFDDVIQKAYRAQVVLVSPSLLMLAIQVMKQIQKDARMREAAYAIRTEVGHLMQDLGRLHERVLNLQRHFGQANEDVAKILTSAEKLARRGGRIESMEFDEDPSGQARLAMPQPLGAKATAAE
jgi:DNA recombination protein RmuC